MTDQQSAVRVPPVADYADLKDWLADVVVAFGGGFHPDTMAEDYIPPLDPESVENLDEGLAVVEEQEWDVYEVGADMSLALLRGEPFEGRRVRVGHHEARVLGFDPEGDVRVRLARGVRRVHRVHPDLVELI